MQGKFFLAYLLVIAIVLALVISDYKGVTNVLRKIPGVGDTISADSDAKSRVVAAQKSLQQKGDISEEKVLTWEDRYLNLREKSGVSRVMKESEGEYALLKQIKRRIEPSHPQRNIIYVEENASLHPREVFLIAIVGKELEWEKRVGFINESTIIENPVEEVSMWVKVDADVANELYTDLQNNATKKELFDKMLNRAMEGRIQISPYERFLELAQEYV